MISKMLQKTLCHFNDILCAEIEGRQAELSGETRKKALEIWTSLAKESNGFIRKGQFLKGYYIHRFAKEDWKALIEARVQSGE